MKIHNISTYLRKSICSVMCLVVTSSIAVSSPTYRVVYYMQQYPSPLGIIEGAPGVFYSLVDNWIYSVTTQGTATYLTNFPDPPYVVESLPVSAANNLFYSSISTNTGPNGGSANVFSVGSTVGSAKTYGVQNISPHFTQNMPDGTLLGIGYLISTTNAGWNIVRVR